LADHLLQVRRQALITEMHHFVIDDSSAIHFVRSFGRGPASSAETSPSPSCPNLLTAFLMPLRESGHAHG
jgi:hypothetical protein